MKKAKKKIKKINKSEMKKIKGGGKPPVHVPLPQPDPTAPLTK